MEPFAGGVCLRHIYNIIKQIQTTETMNTTFLASVFTMQTFKSLSPAFLTGLGLMFFINLLLVTVDLQYLRKKRFPQFLVFLAIVFLVNFAFYAMAKVKLEKDAKEKTSKLVQNVLMPDPGPPKREYPFLRKHTIKRDPIAQTYSAVEPDGTAICLMSGDPPQVYDSSFFLLMQTEGGKLSKTEQMTEMAKFVILLWYRESSPAYFESPQQLADFLIRRHNKIQKQMGKKIKAILQKETENEKKNSGKVLPANQIPSLVNAKNGTLRYMLGRISPPQFEKNWEGATEFRLYTYSLRYNEIAEWSFKIMEDGMLEADKTAYFQATTNPSSDAVAK